MHLQLIIIDDPQFPSPFFLKLFLLIPTQKLDDALLKMKVKKGIGCKVIWETTASWNRAFPNIYSIFNMKCLASLCTRSPPFYLLNHTWKIFWKFHFWNTCLTMKTPIVPCTGLFYNQQCFSFHTLHTYHVFNTTMRAVHYSITVFCTRMPVAAA